MTKKRYTYILSLSLFIKKKIINYIKNIYQCTLNVDFNMYFNVLQKVIQKKTYNYIILYTLYNFEYIFETN